MAIAYNQALVSLIDLETMQPSTDILLLISDLDFVSIPTKKTSKTKLLAHWLELQEIYMQKATDKSQLS